MVFLLTFEKRERERETSICHSTYLCIHWYVPWLGIEPIISAYGDVNRVSAIMAVFKNKMHFHWWIRQFILKEENKSDIFLHLPEHTWIREMTTFVSAQTTLQKFPPKQQEKENKFYIEFSHSCTDTAI